MNREDIEYIVRRLGVTNIKHSPDYVTISCALAPWTHAKGTDRNPSCGIKISAGISPVNCFACGNWGGLLNYVREYGKHAIPDGLITKDALDELIDFILMAEDDSSAVIQVRGGGFDEDLQGIKPAPKVPDDVLDCAGKKLDMLHKFVRKDGRRRLLGDEAYWSEWLLGYIDCLRYIEHGREFVIRNRVMFPVIQRKGDIPLVSCRWFDDNYDESNEPKYKNYPKNSEKSKYLYGAHLHNDKVDTLIVVEGIIDAVNANYALRIAGLDNCLAVSILGSKPSKFQTSMLKSLASQHVVMLDNDEAGRLGAQALYKELSSSSVVYCVEYPEGYNDVDDLVLADLFIDVLDKKKLYLVSRLERIFKNC